MKSVYDFLRYVYTDLVKTLHMPTKYVLGTIPAPIKDAASIQKIFFDHRLRFVLFLFVTEGSERGRYANPL